MLTPSLCMKLTQNSQNVLHCLKNIPVYYRFMLELIYVLNICKEYLKWKPGVLLDDTMSCYLQDPYL